MATSASPDPHARIEVDDAIPDSEAAYGDSVESSTYATSLGSSVLNYKYENGRRYQAFRDGEYILPNDEAEQNRMDVEHHLYRMVLDGGLYRAPIKNPKRVLDFGTGTGIWAIDFADEYPETQIIGSDLSPIQPGWAPPNCSFEIDDVEETWSYKPSEAFDYIHSRDMAGSIKDYDRLFAQAFKHLKPGGYLEMQSFAADFFSDDGTLDKMQNAVRWINLLVDASNKFGKPLDVEATWQAKMEKAGFVGVKDDVYKVPIAPWPKDKKLKELGRYEQFHAMQVLEPYTLALFTRVLKWEKKEVDHLLEGVRSDLKNPSIHAYGKMHFMYAKKPE